MGNRLYNICFVCDGNCIRSPFAEAVVKHFAAKEPELNLKVASCGTINWGVNPRDSTMTDIAKSMGYILDGETTYMNGSKLEDADRIVVFTHEQRNRVTQVLNYSHWDRIVLFDFIAFGQDSEVEDPNYQTLAVYERVAKHIETGCRNIVEILKKDLTLN